MSRTSFLQKFETFIIVTLIAVLVWLYAEVQNVKTFTRVPVRIQLVPPSNQQLAVDPTTPQRILVTFSASNGQKMKFDRLLFDDDRLLQVPIQEWGHNGPVTQPIDISSLLRQSPLRELGISIQETDPPVLSVHVEHLVELELPVEIIWGDLELVDVLPLEIKRAVVTMPQSFAKHAQDKRIVADLTQVDLEGLQEDVPETKTVPLTLPQSLLAQADDFDLDYITIEPAQIEVTFTVRSQKKTTTLNRVPIELRALPTLLRQYQLDIPDEQLVLSGVELTGPSDVIDAIEAREVKIHAYISPTEEELQNEVDTFTPYLDLPPKVGHSPLSPIQITVTPRSSD